MLQPRQGGGQTRNAVRAVVRHGNDRDLVQRVSVRQQPARLRAARSLCRSKGTWHGLLLPRLGRPLDGCSTPPSELQGWGNRRRRVG